MMRKLYVVTVSKVGQTEELGYRMRATTRFGGERLSRFEG